MLVTQMTWVIGNIPEYRVVGLFSQALLTAAPITGDQFSTTFDEPVPTVVEEWINEQNQDPDFIVSLGSLPEIACRQGLYLYAPDDIPPPHHGAAENTRTFNSLHSRENVPFRTR